MAKRVESWIELQGACADLRERIERKIAAECAVLKEHCPNQPLSSLRLDFTHGSNDLLAIVDWQASRVRN